jgi:hypothetical protein
VLITCFLLTVSSCAGKKKTTPELSLLEGKKVALVAIEAEPGARNMIEVALVNQLHDHGSFILVSKQDVESARLRPDIDPLDWKSIAEAAGATVALRTRAVVFEANERQGYSKEEIFDTQLAEDRGDDGKDVRVYKVKGLKARVDYELSFTDLRTGETKIGHARAEDTVTAEAKNESAHLPPRMKYLSDLTERAFKTFFNENN